MKQLLLLVALCTLAAAMVPRERKAVEEMESKKNETTPLCGSDRPCGWDFYPQDHPDSIYDSQANKFCQCSADTTCQKDENDPAGNSWIKRCKTPVTEPATSAPTSS